MLPNFHGIHYEPIQSVGSANPPARMTTRLDQNHKLYKYMKYTSLSGRRVSVIGQTLFPVQEKGLLRLP